MILKLYSVFYLMKKLINTFLGFLLKVWKIQKIIYGGTFYYNLYIYNWH